MEVGDLSPIAQDYLKVIWSAVEWGEPPISTKALAERFATSQANVSETMRRLQRQGLVEYRPYRPVRLTDLGRDLALAMVRRHRLIETFLAQTLGYGWDEVHAEAERLEHAVSPRFIRRIDALLGQPSHDPHGDPIPDPAGNWPGADSALKLAVAPPGRHVVVRVSDDDSAQLGRLAELGLEPGRPILVSAAGQFLLAGAEAAVLPPADAVGIWVRAAH